MSYNRFFPLFSLLCVSVIKKSVSVIDGDPVTLYTDLTDLLKDDVLEWKYENTMIAKFSRKTNMTTYDDIEIFKGKLRVDEKTGSLTINNLDIKHTGDYTLNISNLRRTLRFLFKVRVSGK